MANARTSSDILASKSSDYDRDVRNVCTALGIAETDWVRRRRVSRLFSDPSPLLNGAQIDDVRDAAGIWGYDVATGGDAQADPYADVVAWVLLAAETVMVAVAAPFAEPPLRQLVLELDPANEAIPEYQEIESAVYELALASNNFRGAPDAIAELCETYIDASIDPAADSVNAIQAELAGTLPATAGSLNFVWGRISPTRVPVDSFGQILTGMRNALFGSIAGPSVDDFRAAVGTTTLGAGYPGDAAQDDLHELLDFLTAQLPQ